MGVETLMMAAGGQMIAGQLFQGIQGYQQGMAAKDVTRAQIGATKVQRDRDLTDLRDQRRASLARMRTIFAAQGGSLGGIQESLILKDETYVGAVAESRLLQDYDFRLNTLRATRDNQRVSAMQTLIGSFAKAGMTGTGTALGVQNYKASLLNTTSAGGAATSGSSGMVAGTRG